MDPNAYAGSYFVSQTPAAPSEPPGASAGLLDWLRRSEGGWPGPEAAGGEVERRLLRERTRSGPQGVTLPWFLPYFDEQQTLYENAAMRLAYRRMMSDPNVKAALLGKILAVAALGLKVMPADKKDPQSQADAEFVRWNLEEGLEGGVPGLVWSILSGALIDGYSVCEKVWARESSGEHRGKYYLRAVKPKDTGRDVVLETNEFRDVVGVKGLRYNPGEVFSPADFIIYRHLPLWDTATGTSDLRSVYSRWWMLDTVLKLRAVAAEKRALPVIVGHYTNASDRPPLEDALALVRSQNWLAVPETVRLEALSIAGGAEATFSEFAKDCKHDIFLGIAGAMLQSLEGSIPGGRGSSAEHRDTADLFVWHLSKAIEALLNDRRRGVVRDIVDLNRAAVAYPKAVLASVSVSDQLAALQVSKVLFDMGVKQNLDEVYELAGRTPPDPDDPTTSLGGKVDQDAQLAASTMMARTSDGRPNAASPGVRGALDMRVHDHVRPGEGDTLSGPIPEPVPGEKMDEDASEPAAPRPPAVGDAHEIHAKLPMGGEVLDVKRLDDRFAYIGHPDTPHPRARVPLESYPHFLEDIAGRPSLGQSDDPAVAAVAAGRGELLGKGDDGIAFRHGDEVVKVSTVVPHIPTNDFYRTPSRAAGMLKEQTEVSEEARRAGVPGILPTRFVAAGGRGVQVRPHVEAAEHLDAAQLGRVAEMMRQMHAAGYAMRDLPQVGTLGGELYFYDVGKMRRLPEDERERERAIDHDHSGLAYLYRRNGVEYDPPAEPMDEPTTSTGAVADSRGRVQTYVAGHHVATPPGQTKPDEFVGNFTRTPGRRRKPTVNRLDEPPLPDAQPAEPMPAPEPAPPAVVVVENPPDPTPRLSVYACPLCEDGLALDGDPLRGVVYRELCKCQDCGGSFDRTLGRLLTRQGPALCEIQPETPAE